MRNGFGQLLGYKFFAKFLSNFIFVMVDHTRVIRASLKLSASATMAFMAQPFVNTFVFGSTLVAEVSCSIFAVSKENC